MFCFLRRFAEDVQKSRGSKTMDTVMMPMLAKQKKSKQPKKNAIPKMGELKFVLKKKKKTSKHDFYMVLWFVVGRVTFFDQVSQVFGEEHLLLNCLVVRPWLQARASDKAEFGGAFCWWKSLHFL